ncbi:fructosyl amino acid oxidase [Teratosphaeria destructans]|uniref:Fructosyl amino acid oxidase n=1 Tax=Teratosphaeria destructans TaxID=418781 RepID=A0A9W7SJB3_9PEZI|nr:fructosyl amino acid oxidase [Teratosphaeria destructans]
MPHALRPSYFRSLSSSSKDKPRLYIALYPRGGNATSSTSNAYCDSYHWALTIGSSSPSRKDPATQYHLAHSSTSGCLKARRGSAHTFFLEENALAEDTRSQDAMLIRVAVAKVTDMELAKEVLRSLRPYGKGERFSSCFEWVRVAFSALHKEPGCLKTYFDDGDWLWIEKCAREYCKSKRLQGRFASHAATSNWKAGEVSTFNAWEMQTILWDPGRGVLRGYSALIHEDQAILSRHQSPSWRLRCRMTRISAGLPRECRYNVLQVRKLISLPSAMEPTVLIVGAGTFGTSTAYHLARSYKDPSRVTVVDRSPSPPEHAASIDVNRIIRTDYTSSLYCQLANEAIQGWRWNLDVQQYFHWTGWIVMDEDGSDFSAQVKRVFAKRGSLAVEDLGLLELGDRWAALKGTDTAGFSHAYFNGEAGWCNALAATANVMAVAEKRGVNRVTDEVTELLLDPDGSRVAGVRTAKGQCLTADKVVLAAGAWTSSLMSPIEDALHISEHDRVERQVQATGRVSAYYHVSQEEADRLTKIPVVLYGEIGEVIPPSRENRTIKYNDSRHGFVNTITTKGGRRISVPVVPERDQYDVPASIQEETHRSLTSRLMPHLTRGRRADYWRMCWDAVTPTEDWLMCKHPHSRLKDLYLAVGGSFHSYKFLPNAGKYMLNVLDGRGNGVEKDRAWGWKDGETLRTGDKRSHSRREFNDLVKSSLSYHAKL